MSMKVVHSALSSSTRCCTSSGAFLTDEKKLYSIWQLSAAKLIAVKVLTQSDNDSAIAKVVCNGQLWRL